MHKFKWYYGIRSFLYLTGITPIFSSGQAFAKTSNAAKMCLLSPWICGKNHYGWTPESFKLELMQNKVMWIPEWDKFNLFYCNKKCIYLKGETCSIAYKNVIYQFNMIVFIQVCHNRFHYLYWKKRLRKLHEEKREMKSIHSFTKSHCEISWKLFIRKY